MAVPIIWKSYFFSVDFSPEHEFLQSILSGQTLESPTSESLAAIFHAYDRKVGKDQWIGAGETLEYNLNGAVAFYNGPNSRDYPTNSKYTHVLMLQFPDGSLAPVGRIYIQYNVPAPVEPPVAPTEE
ncbi:hypothetical protein D3C85_128280 [compost metagenome]